jgi:hypothetical protein
MSEKIEPALTPEEWADAIRDRAGMAAAIQKAWGAGVSHENDHQLAALALIYQPFGFTQTHINALRQIIDLECSDMLRPVLRDLTARIAALLPPER